MKTQGANKASIIHEGRFTPDHGRAAPNVSPNDSAFITPYDYKFL